jgi:7-cyano-7-deazaguanine synthase
MKYIVALSGGMDSATLLGKLFEQSSTEEIHCCLFNYGSKHERWEMRAAKNLVHFYSGFDGPSIIPHAFDLTSIMGEFNSNLLQTGGEIPEGHYENENMKKTVVPGRNMIFISIMAGLAESLGVGTICLGVHSGDHHIYPDCRPDFIYAARWSIYHSTDKRIQLHTPFLFLNKTKILEIGYGLDIPVPYQLTRTCYKDQELSCGKCGSCTERLESFANIGKEDPINYE